MSEGSWDRWNSPEERSRQLLVQGVSLCAAWVRGRGGEKPFLGPREGVSTYTPRPRPLPLSGEASSSSVASPGTAGHALLFRDHVVLKKDFKARAAATRCAAAAAQGPLLR